MENIINIWYKFMWREKCRNGIILEKLDRGIVNYEWVRLYLNIFIKIGLFI